MSGPAAIGGAASDLVLDAGVLMDVPTCEWQGWGAVVGRGGMAVLPWRSQARAATAARVTNQVDALGMSGFAQAVVRIGKGRLATEADLSSAWQALAPSGRLLIVGTNDVGIATWAKRLAEQIGVPGEVLANRAHGRVVAFPRTSATLPRPSPRMVPLPDGTALQVAPGVFSSDGLDGGTKLLLQVLSEVELPPDFAGNIVDVGCGAGHLGLAAARRWPAAQVTLLDADARAVACAQANIPAAGLAGPRPTVTWWDEFDPWPVSDADLVLMNPPCHAGTTLDLSIARRLFACAIGQRVLVVANRQLAYEDDVRRIGEVECVADDGRFKVLSVVRFAPY